MWSVLWTLACAMTLLAGACALYGQTSPGTIQGSVVDPGGRAIGGAAVAVTSGPELKRTAVTDSDGKFGVTGLPAGNYTVEVSATGFATKIQENVAVSAGAVATVPVSLILA
jgi:hypothetical protein